MNKRTISAVLLSMCLILFAAGCKKKTPAPPPPPPAPTTPAPAPAKPSIQFSAEPSSVERGQSATLRWTVSDATSVSITPAIGTVDTKGSRQVSPTDTTTYTLTAEGPGGKETASATVNVTVPPPPKVEEKPKPSLSELLGGVEDAYYDYDKSDIREDARAVLTSNADKLKSIFSQFPDAVIVMEGHCDERGSAEYNLGLGDHRASSAKDFLTQLGISADKLKTISYGKEKPQCTESNESCWQKNRRVHFSAQ